MKNVLKAIIVASLAVALVASCKKESESGKSSVSVEYVEIEAKYDGTNVTKLKWAKQNLATSESGNKVWKGDNNSAVKVPGTDKDVIVGDYFQWGAYQGYCGNSTDADKGLLVYTAFSCSSYDGSEQSSAFTFKDGKSFVIGNAPYYSGSAWTKYTGSDNKPKLESSDDAATIMLTGSWRMPTKEEFEAMKAATYWKWDATDKGYYVYAPNPSTDAGKVNNGEGTYNKAEALLFFPAAGYGDGSSLDSAGTCGRYWSSTLNTDDVGNASSLYFIRVNVNPSRNDYRYYGRSVRPVSD